jgi:hypothetical protein
MEDHNERCLFCPLTAQVTVRDTATVSMLHTFCCPNCGQYDMTLDAYLFHEGLLQPYTDRFYLISGALREYTDQGGSSLRITEASLDQLLAAPWIPRTIRAKQEKLLHHLYLRTQSFGQYIDIRYPEWLALAYANNVEELLALFRALESRGYIIAKLAYGIAGIMLTAEGIEHIEEQSKMPSNETNSAAPQHIVFNGPVGQLNIAQDHATIHVTGEVSVNDPTRLPILLESLMQALQQEQAVSRDEQAALIGLLRDVQRQVQTKTPDIDVLTRCVERIKLLLETVKAGAEVLPYAQHVLTALALYAQQHGISLPTVFR